MLLSADINLARLIANNGTEPNKCMSCYGGEEKPGQCCNTCEEVRESYRKKGWAMDQLDQVEQCKEEVEIEKMSKEEGCQVRETWMGPEVTSV